MARSDRVDLYHKIEELRNSKLIVYITGDRTGMETQIHSDVLDYFVDHLDPLTKVNKISLYLYTRGGSTLTAWSLVNLIKQFCNEFEVILPAKAHSSGTLISIGANNIIMTKQATLGPVDPSVNGPLNPQNPTTPDNPRARLPVSVESIQGYFDLARNNLGIKKQDDLTKVFSSLTEHIHPLVLGDVYRSRAQIQMLARKLLSNHIEDSRTIDKITSFITSGSGSHDYMIYRSEAKDELGLHIEKPDDALYNVIKAVFLDIQKELELLIPYDLTTLVGEETSADYSCRRSLLESLHGGTDVFVSEGTISQQKQIMPQPPPMPPIERSVVNDHRRFEGWRRELPMEGR